MPLDTPGMDATGTADGQVRYTPVSNRIHYQPVTDQVRFLPVKERVVVKGSPEHVRIKGTLVEASSIGLDQAV